MVGGLGLSAVFAVILVVAGADGRRLSALLGATDAAAGEFPFQVSIERDGFYVCNGVIISDRHIVTAAHCISNITNLNHVIVRTGSIIRGLGERHTVKLALYHREYQFTADSPNDIAVIVLASPIVFDQNQRAIKLASAPTPINAAATISGWGFTSISTTDISTVLQKLNVITLESTECSAKLAHRGKVLPSHICTAGAPGRGTCYYDSGSPLVYGGELIGVLSYGIPCGRGFPDVFTSTYVYNSWLETIITTT